MAGVRAIEEILKIDRDAFDITIFGSEPHPNYNRILLSKVLQGDTTIDDITINDWNWYKENGITLYSGESVVKIDTERRLVHTDRNRQVEYDELIVATGSLPFMLPLPGADKQGVTAFRDIRDCERMIETSKTYKKAVVIGGGLLGLEAARGLLNLGMQVDVVHLQPYLMERQLDMTAGKMLQRELEKQGMNFLLEKQTEKIIGKNRVEGLKFKDGSKVAADLVVMAVGIKPNVQLAKDSNIEVNRGILVNDYMQTKTPHVYAVGECAEHREIVYGLVAPLYEQAKVLAQKICGVEGKRYQGSIPSTQLKVSGVDVYSSGVFQESENTRSLQVYDEINGIYKKVVVTNNKIIGAVLFGDISEAGKLTGLINQRADISELTKISLFQSANQGTGEGLVAQMDNKEMVCACNSVTKGDIVQAIKSQGLSTIEQVKECTRASSSCGGCKPLVNAILEYTLQHDHDPVEEEQTEPICACTAYSHQDVVKEMRKTKWSHVDEVMSVLGWSNVKGCGVCRPALQFYLSVLQPAEHEGDLECAEPVLQREGSPSFRKSLQMVSTCTCGESYLPETHHPVELGMSLVKRLERLPLPHMVKMGVSSCLQNCAEPGTKDFGVVGVEGGWEIYVGGYNGLPVRPGQLLCTVSNDEEVLEMASAFLQLYRETAHYLERTHKWVERVGVENIREVLFHREARALLMERMETALLAVVHKAEKAVEPVHSR